MVVKRQSAPTFVLVGTITFLLGGGLALFLQQIVCDGSITSGRCLPAQPDVARERQLNYFILTPTTAPGGAARTSAVWHSETITAGFTVPETMWLVSEWQPPWLKSRMLTRDEPGIGRFPDQACYAFILHDQPPDEGFDAFYARQRSYGNAVEETTFANRQVTVVRATNVPSYADGGIWYVFPHQRIGHDHSDFYIEVTPTVDDIIAGCPHLENGQVERDLAELVASIEIHPRK